MRKIYPSVIKQLVILGMQLAILDLGAGAAMAAGATYIPGFYGSAAAVLPQPAANALPSGENVITGIDSIARSGSTMTVHQGQPRAVIHWQNFDIGSQASVNFDQQNNSSWKVLNTVTGNGYSQIFGSLTATGQVYILNQNGILFGPGSQINVHSLTASALNLKESDFLNLPDFAQGGTETYTYSSAYPANATVANHGTITAGNLGSVFLIGPQVENNGIITATGGDIALLAGGQVAISQGTYSVFSYNVQGLGTSATATNFSAGQILSDMGNSNMYGSVVNQNGLIRATTALQKNGTIQLVGTNRVTTGVGSLTETPVDQSGDRMVIDPSQFKQGSISISASNGTIDHYGQILSPGGNVSLTALNRVILENGSSIDVSGSWVNLTAADRIISVQLNSDELRDAFLYKNGPLQGQTVQVDITTGLSFADISGYLASMPKSAPEMTTKGGTITLTATGGNSDVIVSQGASLNFSGGGLHYASGLFPETMVRIGTNIYTLQNMPAGVPIDEVLGTYSKTYQRYGVTDTWTGLYYGGPSPYLSFLSAFTQGADAGTLTLIGSKVVLDGTMNASVVTGIYQNLLADPTDQNGNPAAVGRKAPQAGTLTIGQSAFLTSPTNDLKTQAIEIKNEVAPTSVTGDTPLPDQNDPIRISQISAQSINASGLGNLNLYANGTVKVDADAKLTLADLGSINVQAQSIEQYGSIRIPSGTVNFSLVGIAPQLQDRTFLADGSSIDVSGQRLDNSAAKSGSPLQAGFTFGGSVNLIDQNPTFGGEILLSGGSSIKANGGYTINADNSISGGKAGSIAIEADTVQPDGHLSGLALEGSEGGSLTLWARQMTVAQSGTSLPAGFQATDPLPGNLTYNLVLADNRFAGTGFTHITLQSEDDFQVQAGVSLAPSAARLARPVLTPTGYQIDQDATVTARPEEFGPSSLSLAAAKKIYIDYNAIGSLNVDASVSLSGGPAQGSISLQGFSVTVGGSLKAPAGNITVSTTGGNLVVGPNTTMDASGTTLLDLKSSLPNQVPNMSVLGGGTVSLSAGGDVVLSPGSLIDVSGSQAVTNLSVDQNGKIVGTTTAAAAGTVNITFINNFTSNGVLRGASVLPWLPGGSLSITKTGYSGLALQADTVSGWLSNGFDDLSFSSMREISFIAPPSGTVAIAANRGLSLNASAIVGSGGQDITLSAPWLQISNVEPNTDSDNLNERTFATANTGTAHLMLAGDFIDIQGNIALSGFAGTTIRATDDLRLYDYFYTTGWSGALNTAGNLTLQASAIYPAMHASLANAASQDNTNTIYSSSFAITAGQTDANGNLLSGKGSQVTILPSDQPLPQSIYSAGGSLSIQAGNIDDNGVLAAPMGTISLTAQNRISLGGDSVLSTRGQGMTLYGMQDNGVWTVSDKSSTVTVNPSLNVTAAPEKSITISASTITQSSDAKIDVGGGGSIFSYQFLPGYDGTDNPLGVANRYVIMPDNSIVFPGKTVYLDGMAGLKPGFYSLLPVQYAFLPGAMIIQDSGQAMQPGRQLVTSAGYTMISGYLTDRSVTTVSPLRSGFIIRKASDVLTEGDFDTMQYVAGDAGQIKVSGSTTLLAGPLLADALAGYNGGTLALSGQNISVGATSSQLDANWLHNLSFDTVLPAQLAGTLTIETASIDNSGLQSVQIGDAKTATVTFMAGSTLEGVPQVNVTATNSISLQPGAQIYAAGDPSSGLLGTLTLNANTLYGAGNTLLHASDALNFNINNLSAYTYTGNIQVDHGAFQVNSGVFYFEPASYTGVRNNTGFYLSSAMLDAFKSIDTVVLKSASDMIFLGNVNLAAKGDLTLDAARITVNNSQTTDPTWGPPMVYPYSVNIGAGGTLSLQNSSAVSGGTSSYNGNTINLAATTVSFGPGNLIFDSFKAVNIASQGDTVFNGTGTLTANLNAGGSISFSASRYIADLQSNPSNNGSGASSYTLSSFQINGGSGNVFMAGNGQAAGSAMAVPGNLTVSGTNIYLNNALFNIPGGLLNFQAQQNIVAKGSSILATGGNLNFPVTAGGLLYDNIISLDGGQVTMQSATGAVSIDGTSLIDTSASPGQAGGAITLSAPQNGVTLNGTVRGAQISVDTNAITNFSALAGTIAAGGFGNQVNLRARNGNITIGSTDTVNTSSFILTADQGNIDIFGTINASGQDKGGTVEISSAGDLTLQASGRILARGNGGAATGGSVFLASENGAVKTLSSGSGSSLIDVTGAGGGGTVTFRVSRDVITAGGMLLNGLIQGAAQASVDAFRVYQNSNVTTANINQYINDINQAWPSLQAALSKYSFLSLIPEIEVRSSGGTMTLASGLNNLDSLTAEMPNGIPGILTFRSAGNLTVTSNIVDAPQSSLFEDSLTQYAPVANGIRDSWDLNFIAGADLGSSRLTAVQSGVGNFTVGSSGSGNVIYTESGNITFASGGNTVIYALSSNAAPLSYMPGTNRYNLASFDGAIRGSVGGDLDLQGGIIQTAVSDISLQVGNNVNINTYVDKSGKKWYGAIRTTGRAPTVAEIPEFVPLINQYGTDALSTYALERYWEYRDGGNISLAAGGNITGNALLQSDGSGWDYTYNDKLTAMYLGVKTVSEYGADYGVQGTTNGAVSGQGTHDIATMAGGSIDIKAAAVSGQFGAFGNGDLTVYAGGPLSGRFLAEDGNIRLTSLADFGRPIGSSSGYETLIELGAGNLTIQALGNVSLGTICNPDFTSMQKTWQLNYNEDSTVDIDAALGDVLISGKDSFVANDSSFRYRVLPGSLDITAAQDILLTTGSNFLIMAPSPTGQLNLIAGRDINGMVTAGLSAGTYNISPIFMSAADPSVIYGNQGTNYSGSQTLLEYGTTSGSPLHAGDTPPVVVAAGRDIADIAFSVPKLADISAGRDIREIEYWGQNTGVGDVSLISAGRDLSQLPSGGQNISETSLGINQAGRGFLIVQAGDSIDLGTSSGIQSTGSNISPYNSNSALFTSSDLDSYDRYKGADVAVISGYDLEPGKQQLAGFFSALTDYGAEFSALMATGKQDDQNAAALLKEQMLNTLIDPLLGGKKSGSGNISMTQSTIKTTSGMDDLYILAAGKIDVGTSVINANKDTSKGILTEGGGNIDIFAEGDINVNESRVVTYFSGDIFMLSDHGNIEAGRGSKTSVSPMASGFLDVGGKLVASYSAPAPGSGIRTLTADPDGPGPLTAPPQGKISLIAWEGVIDAGEAGISAGNIILAATKILNAQNINFTDTGVGVPVASQPGPSLGALAGASTVAGSQTASSSMEQQVLANDKSIAESVSKMAEGISMKMLIFKLEGFSDDVNQKSDQNNSDSRGNVDGSI
jgi:filamentous hemagglutinin